MPLKYGKLGYRADNVHEEFILTQNYLKEQVSNEGVDKNNIFVDQLSEVESVIKEDVESIPMQNDDPLNDVKIESVEPEGAKLLKRNCQICSKEVVDVGHRVLQHYTSHFTHEIRDKFGDFMDFDNFECKLCSANTKNKRTLTIHMGMVHMKVNSILIDKGFEPFKKTRDSKKCTKENDYIREHFTCQICRNPTKTIGDLWNHYKSLHYTKSPEEDHNKDSTGLNCNSCTNQFPISKSHHIASH